MQKSILLFIVCIFSVSISTSRFFVYGYLQGVSRDLDEAAIIDGAND